MKCQEISLQTRSCGEEGVSTEAFKTYAPAQVVHELSIIQKMSCKKILYAALLSKTNSLFVFQTQSLDSF